MIIEIYIVVDDKGDRPYVSTSPPSAERLEALRARGCRLYVAPVHVPEAHGHVLPYISAEPVPLG
jgi:hypothetical protein